MKTKTLIIDNYDSFSYNLYQYFGELSDEVCVIKNDEKTCEEIEDKIAPTHIVISPGPGRPCDAGMCEKAALYFAGKTPIMGVCLGHQAICEAYGGDIVHAKKLMHGKRDTVSLDLSSPIFKSLPQKMNVARYHSLAAANLPDCLEVISTATDGEIMGVKHKKYSVYGLQFHPESILTDNGKIIIKNFLEMTEEN